MEECPQISNLQTESKYFDSLNFYSIFTDLVGGWVGGWQWGHPLDICACMHAHVHKHACMLNMINMAASMVVAICNLLTYLF